MHAQFFIFKKIAKNTQNNFLVILFPDATEMKSRPERKVHKFILYTFGNKNKYTATYMT